MNQQKIIDTLRQMAEKNSTIDVVWLYGSQAKGNADANSDYDLAIAFDQNSVIKQAYYSDELADQWSQAAQQDISIVDINRAPTPLAYNVINEGVVIFCQNPLRLHAEQARIWSLWEAYRYEHLKNRA